MSKRLNGVIISDTHCGHRTGLTPPSCWVSDSKDQSEIGRLTAGVQRQQWDFFEKVMFPRRGKLDIMIFNGDAIDGQGKKNGGIEMLTTDRSRQVDMASEIVRYINPHQSYIARGTPYHTGKEEEWESQLARDVDAAACGDHLYLDMNGCVFSVRHKVTSSSVPHGRFTSIARQRYWNLIKSAEIENYPRADVLIRSHVHYYEYLGGPTWLAMTTPSLQGATSFGSRECEGEVHFGLITFSVSASGEFKWQSHIKVIPLSVPKMISV